MIRFAITAGAVFAVLSVILGAFGAHAIADMVSAERLETWHTAAKYLMSHGQALIIVGILAQVFKKPLKWTVILLFSGTCVFSSSLFLLVITDTPWLGVIAPIGGFLMISGWLSLATVSMNQFFQTNKVSEFLYTGIKGVPPLIHCYPSFQHHSSEDQYFSTASFNKVN